VIGKAKTHRGDAEARRKLKSNGPTVKVKTSTQRNFGGRGDKEGKILRGMAQMGKGKTHHGDTEAQRNTLEDSHG